MQPSSNANPRLKPATPLKRYVTPSRAKDEGGVAAATNSKTASTELDSVDASVRIQASTTSRSESASKSQITSPSAQSSLGIAFNNPRTQTTVISSIEPMNSPSNALNRLVSKVPVSTKDTSVPGSINKSSNSAINSSDNGLLGSASQRTGKVNGIITNSHPTSVSDVSEPHSCISSTSKNAKASGDTINSLELPSSTDLDDFSTKDTQSKNTSGIRKYIATVATKPQSHGNTDVLSSAKVSVLDTGKQGVDAATKNVVAKTGSAASSKSSQVNGKVSEKLPSTASGSSETHPVSSTGSSHSNSSGKNVEHEVLPSTKKTVGIRPSNLIISGAKLTKNSDIKPEQAINGVVPVSSALNTSSSRVQVPVHHPSLPYANTADFSDEDFESPLSRNTQSRLDRASAQAYDDFTGSGSPGFEGDLSVSRSLFLSSEGSASLSASDSGQLQFGMASTELNKSLDAMSLSQSGFQTATLEVASELPSKPAELEENISAFLASRAPAATGEAPLSPRPLHSPRVIRKKSPSRTATPHKVVQRNEELSAAAAIAMVSPPAAAPLPMPVPPSPQDEYNLTDTEEQFDRTRARKPTAEPETFSHTVRSARRRQALTRPSYRRRITLDGAVAAEAFGPLPCSESSDSSDSSDSSTHSPSAAMRSSVATRPSLSSRPSFATANGSANAFATPVEPFISKEQRRKESYADAVRAGVQRMSAAKRRSLVARDSLAVAVASATPSSISIHKSSASVSAPDSIAQGRPQIPLPPHSSVPRGIPMSPRAPGPRVGARGTANGVQLAGGELDSLQSPRSRNRYSEGASSVCVAMPTRQQSLAADFDHVEIDLESAFKEIDEDTVNPTNNIMTTLNSPAISADNSRIMTSHRHLPSQGPLASISAGSTTNPTNIPAEAVELNVLEEAGSGTSDNGNLFGTTLLPLPFAAPLFPPPAQPTERHYRASIADNEDLYDFAIIVRAVVTERQEEELRLAAARARAAGARAAHGRTRLLAADATGTFNSHQLHFPRWRTAKNPQLEVTRRAHNPKKKRGEVDIEQGYGARRAAKAQSLDYSASESDSHASESSSGGSLRSGRVRGRPNSADSQSDEEARFYDDWDEEDSGDDEQDSDDFYESDDDQSYHRSSSGRRKKRSIDRDSDENDGSLISSLKRYAGRGLSQMRNSLSHRRARSARGSDSDSDIESGNENKQKKNSRNKSPIRVREDGRSYRRTPKKDKPGKSTVSGPKAEAKTSEHPKIAPTKAAEIRSPEEVVTLFPRSPGPSQQWESPQLHVLSPHLSRPGAEAPQKRAHKCAEVLEALRAAGLIAKRIRSLSRRTWLIKVRCPEWRLELEAEKLRLRLRRRDGGWSKFRRGMRAAFAPAVELDEDPRLSFHVSQSEVELDLSDEDSAGLGRAAPGVSLFHSSDRQALINHIIRSSAREGGAELGEGTPLGAYVSHMFPLHMQARLEELRNDWLRIWLPECSFGDRDRMGVLDEEWYAPRRLVPIDLDDAGNGFSVEGNNNELRIEGNGTGWPQFRAWLVYKWAQIKSSLETPSPSNASDSSANPNSNSSSPGPKDVTEAKEVRRAYIVDEDPLQTPSKTSGERPDDPSGISPLSDRVFVSTIPLPEESASSGPFAWLREGLRRRLRALNNQAARSSTVAALLRSLPLRLAQTILLFLFALCQLVYRAVARAMTQPLDRIAAYFGETIGFYFAWLQYYTHWLVVPAVLGVLLFVGQLYYGTVDIAYAPLFSLAMALWSIVFLEFWKRKNAELAQRWGVLQFEAEETLRPQFNGTWMMDAATGETLRVYPRHKRLLKYCLSVPVVLGWVAGVVALMILVYGCRDHALAAIETSRALELIRTEVASNATLQEWTASGLMPPAEDPLHGSGLDLGVIVQRVVAGGLREFLSGEVRDFSRNFHPLWLAVLEDVRSRTSSAPSSIDSGSTGSILNSFKFSSLSDIDLSLSKLFNNADFEWWAVMVIPPVLLGLLMPLLDFIFGRIALAMNDWENHATESRYRHQRIAKVFFVRFTVSFVSLFYYAFSPQHSVLQLSVQLAAFLTVGQLWNNVLELAVPEIVWRVRECGFRRRVRHAEDSGLTEGRRGRRLLRHAQCQAWRESRMLRYDSFNDYAEMLIQFGYVTFFSWAFPLAPLAAMLNNLVEMRTDAHKLCFNTQRPIAHKASGIGVWYNVLVTMSLLAVLTNCAHLALVSTQFQNFFPDLTATERILVVFIFEHLVLSMRLLSPQLVDSIPKHVQRRIQRDHLAHARLMGRQSYN